MDEPITKTENQTPDQEDKDALKTELEAERAKTASAVQEATGALQEKLTALEGQIQAAVTEAKTFSDEAEGAKAAYAYAVADFKALALQANPMITPDLVAGETVDAVKASVARANALIARVKEGLEKQAATFAQLASVPAGAPQRTEPDLGAMSTVEKINYGLEQAKKKK